MTQDASTGFEILRLSSLMLTRKAPQAAPFGLGRMPSEAQVQARRLTATARGASPQVASTARGDSAATEDARTSPKTLQTKICQNQRSGTQLGGRHFFESIATDIALATASLTCSDPGKRRALE